MQGRKKLLGQILKERGWINEGHIQEALSIQRFKGRPLGQILIQEGSITPEQLSIALGIQGGMEVVELEKVEIPKEIITKLDPSTASVFRVVPLKLEKGCLTVVLADPANISILSDLEFLLNCKVKAAISTESAVTAAINKYYGKPEENAKAILRELEGKKGGREGAGEGVVDLEDAEAMARATPIVRLINYILFQAIRDKASDIHLEPFEDEFKIRYRVDGALYELEAPPKHLAQALISRIKVMSSLDIAETRVPQDGRIELSISGKPVDLRVSTLPTMFGESCVLRVLDRSVVSLNMEQLGLRENSLRAVRNLIRKPHGILLVTGPTGCGKTTTLYSALNEINDVEIKIITTEDPIEYDLEGIIQVQINEEIGVTYAKCLRSILRQDPDKILVGEIRDRETAQIAVEAALTGHLVFSTLHTNDAPSAITRLIDIGVEPYLIAATLEAVVAQRLVRRICPQCKVFYEPKEEALLELGLSQRDVAGKRFAMGEGCPACRNTGYSGRMGIFEILIMNERIRQLVIDNAPTGRLREAAREGGMQTLRESGLRSIFDGATTLEEVVRETMVLE